MVQRQINTPTFGSASVCAGSRRTCRCSRSRARCASLLWWLGSVLSITAPLFALSPEKSPEQFARTWWTRVEGLPQSAVQAIARSDPGYLWIGTQDGLARYNGDDFLVFRAEDTPALRSDFITSLHDGGGGRLWIGTRRGLVLFEQGEFRRIGSSELLDEAYIRSLGVGEDGRVWVGTSGAGLFSVEPSLIAGSEEQVVRVEGSRSPVIRALLPRDLSTVWVGGSEGLELVSLGSPPPVPAAIRSEVAGRSVRALAGAEDGVLWVGFEDGELIGFTSDGRVLAREEPQLGSIAALLEDRHGSLWVAGARGVARRLDDGTWTSLTEIEPRTISAYSLFEDRGGSLWIGQRRGLLRLGDGSVTVFGPRQGLPDSFVRVVLEDTLGRLWVGSSEGLAVRLPGQQEFREVTLPPEHREVRSLWSDGAALFVGTRSGALRATSPREAWASSPAWSAIEAVRAAVNVIEGGPSGRLWIGTQGEGLWQVALDDAAPGRDVLSGRERSERVVRALAWQGDARDGRLWIGTEAGLLVWQGGATTALRLTPPELEPVTSGETAMQTVVLALHVDAAGDLWLGTGEHGLARLRGREQVWFDHRHGLFDDLVFRIVEDQRDNFWMTGNRGISVVARAELEAVAAGQQQRLSSRWFDESDGLLDAECNGGTQPAGWLDVQGRLWVPTVEGLARVEVDSVADANTDSIAVWIEEVRLDGTPLEPVAGRYVLPPGQRNLELQWASAGHLSSAQSRFEYRLLGFEDDWVSAGSRRSARFPSLPPGDYTFDVRALSRFGTARSAPPVEIDAPPTLFERRAFWWGLFVLGLLLVAAISRWRVRDLREQRLRLQQLVEQRTQELASAVHDLERLAAHDALTGLANPRRLHEHLAAEWSRAQRSGQPISCLMIDVDHFKQINDQRGHAAGDEVLIAIAGALRLHVRREGELLARRSGDEFVVILPGTSANDALRLAEAMRRQVEVDLAGLGMREAWPLELNATVSIGVASTVATHGEPPARLLDLADEAAYRAKWEGRNRVSQ